MNFAKAVLVFSLSFNLIQAPKPPERLKVEHIYPTTQTTQVVHRKKTIYNMTNSELSKLSVKKKAKLVHMSVKTFKTFTRLVSRESGPKMNDKIMVAATIWNRKYCKSFPNTIKKVMHQPGQFTLKGQKKTKITGNPHDKQAQLAILIAYRDLHQNKIPHNVLFFNSISYKMKSKTKFKKYKHYNNYFVKYVTCNCKWCKTKAS